MSAQLLPKALRELVNRSCWATFRVQPRPQSVGESMQFYTNIQQLVSPHGSIVHYKQSVCPVTKERLEKLQVSIEDHSAKPERVDVIHNSVPLVSDLTPLESESSNHFKEGRSQLTSLTRDYERFKNAVHK